MDRDEVVQLIAPVRDRMVECVRLGCEDYVRLNPAQETRATIGPTTRANYVHDRIRHRLELEFGFGGPVRMDNEGQLHFLKIDGDKCSVGLRFKKLNPNTHRSCNYPTGQQQFIISQGTFPFACELGQAILGYVEAGDDINPLIERIVLTHETTKGVEWLYRLWHRAPAAQPVAADAVASPVMSPAVPIEPHEHLKEEKKDRG